MCSTCRITAQAFQSIAALSALSCSRGIADRSSWPHLCALFDVGTRKSCPFWAGILCALAVPPRTVVHTAILHARHTCPTGDHLCWLASSSACILAWPHCMPPSSPMSSAHRPDGRDPRLAGAPHGHPDTLCEPQVQLPVLLRQELQCRQQHVRGGPACTSNGCKSGSTVECCSC